MRLEILNRSRCRLPSANLLRRAAALALAPLATRARGRRLATTLVCVGAGRMRRLNRRFTGRGELTDVLSFEEFSPDADDARCYRAGEVVICSEAARRQAGQRPARLRAELLLYAVHGWLHLAGGRDGSARARAGMVAAERRVMAALGMVRPD